MSERTAADREPSSQGSLPRAYVVGLPVCVEVHDDGTVTYSVDVSEAAEAVAEGEWDPEVYHPPIDPEDVERDVERLQQERKTRGGWTPAVEAVRL